jgi:EmrB/QacA subfamily drug resistance transporter
VVVALLLAVFMSAMEATVIGTAMPTVVADLGGLLLYGWVGSSYLLASTVSVPLYGKLADLSGRRPVLLFAIGLFLVGSVWSGFAGSIEELIVARALQGLGAGGIQPVTFTILGDLYTLAERGRVQAFFGAMWGLAGAFGPVLGGILVAELSWRWVFWINVPFGIASAFVLVTSYHERPVRREARLDWAGAFLLTSGSIALLAAAQRVQVELTLPLAAVLLTLFVRVERHAAEPVVPLTMITERSVLVASSAVCLLGAAMSTSVTFLPLAVQGIMARSPSEAGTAIAPLLFGWPIAAAITSRTITRVGFRLPVVIGSLVIAAALVALGWSVEVAGPDASLWLPRVAMGGYGFGMGLTSTSLLLAVQTGVGAEQRGVATALNLFARSIGGALGVGALGAVFSGLVGAELSEDVVASLLDPHGRSAEVGDPHVIESLAVGLRPVFWTLAVLGLVNVVVVAFYPRGPRTDP